MLKTSKPISDALKAEWDMSKNTHLDMEKTSAGSGKKAWWKCSLEHSWEAVIASRTDGRGCPYCSNRKVWRGFNDLESLHPDVAKSWVTELNSILPSEITPGSSKKIFWWKCDKEHQWESSIYDRINNKDACPYCANRLLLKGFNDLKTVYPEIAQQWDYTKNKADPSEVFSNDQKNIHWVCIKGHTWKTSVYHRTASKSNCPTCAFAAMGHERSGKAAQTNNFAEIHPEIATSWSPKNLPLLPSSVAPNSHKIFFWMCTIGHEWKARVSERLRQKNCPYCTNNRVWSGFNDLATVNPILAQEWHPTKNSVNILEVHAGSKTHVWWQCSICTHEWEAGIVERNVGNGCPNCKRKKAAIRQGTPTRGINDFATINPHLISEWSDENAFRPEDIKSGSKRRVIWECSVVKTHKWETLAKHRTQGSDCPLCSSTRQTSKAEEELYDLLISSGLIVERRNKSLLKRKEIDLYLPDYKFGIEYNGLYWHSEMTGKTRMYHANKYKAAQDAGIELFNVWEDDWVAKKELVLRTLFARIGRLDLLNNVLGLNLPDSIDAKICTFMTLSEDKAVSFLGSNHLLGSPSVGEYGALVDGTGSVVAVLAFRKTSVQNQIELLRYASNRDVINGLERLLSWVKSSSNSKSCIASVQLGIDSERFLLDQGFAPVKTHRPNFSYMFRNKRVPAEGYDLARFKNDSDLKFKDSMSVQELVMLNRLYVIWDAGTKQYLKLFTNVQTERTE